MGESVCGGGHFSSRMLYLFFGGGVKGTGKEMSKKQTPPPCMTKCNVCVYIQCSWWPTYPGAAVEEDEGGHEEEEHHVVRQVPVVGGCIV